MFLTILNLPVLMYSLFDKKGRVKKANHFCAIFRKGVPHLPPPLQKIIFFFHLRKNSVQMINSISTYYGPNKYEDRLLLLNVFKEKVRHLTEINSSPKK